MTHGIKHIWKAWKAKQQKRVVNKYLKKRTAILHQGLHVYADVQDCYATCLTAAQLTLVRLKLSIPVKERLSVETISTAFISTDAQQLISRRLRIKFLPGDLSHVVITG